MKMFVRRLLLGNYYNGCLLAATADKSGFVTLS